MASRFDATGGQSSQFKVNQGWRSVEGRLTASAAEHRRTPRRGARWAGGQEADYFVLEGSSSRTFLFFSPAKRRKESPHRGDGAACALYSAALAPCLRERSGDQALLFCARLEHFDVRSSWRERALLSAAVAVGREARSLPGSLGLHRCVRLRDLRFLVPCIASACEPAEICGLMSCLVRERKHRCRRLRSGKEKKGRRASL